MPDRTQNAEWIRWAVLLMINITIIVSSIILAYGGLDKRLSIVETKQEQKVDGEKIQILLKTWKDEIIEQMKQEIKALDNAK